MVREPVKATLAMFYDTRRVASDANESRSPDPAADPAAAAAADRQQTRGGGGGGGGGGGTVVICRGHKRPSEMCVLSVQLGLHGFFFATGGWSARAFG